VRRENWSLTIERGWLAVIVICVIAVGILVFDEFSHAVETGGFSGVGGPAVSPSILNIIVVALATAVFTWVICKVRID